MPMKTKTSALAVAQFGGQHAGQIARTARRQSVAGAVLDHANGRDDRSAICDFVTRVVVSRAVGTHMARPEPPG